MPEKDELLSYRAEFPILESTTYMISHSLGAMPRKVYDKLRDFADTWATRGIRAWAEGWWALPITTGNLLAPLIGVDENQIVMHQNVSIAVSLILSSFDYKAPRNEILYMDVDFPTLGYVLEAQKKHGANVTAVASEDGLKVPLDLLIDSINEQTLVVALSYIFFKTSEKIDVQRVVKKAHEMVAYVLLDLYQAAGVVPLSVKDWDIDFAVGGSVKWLCGGPGAGYVYVKPSLYSALEPAVTGWAAHEHPFAFETGSIRLANDSTRFLHGTPQISPLYQAQAGYEIIHQIGVERIRQKSLRQTSRIIELAGREGWSIQTPRDAERRGGTIVLNVPNGDAVLKEMTARNVLADYRPGAGIRISPHFYTLDSEIDHTFEVISDILKTKAYEKHLQQRGSLY
jgi:kynureninase